jgi:sulfoxide reductase heme-binding subunit YedZ
MSDIDHTYWYLSRAAGIVAYLLLFTGTVLGLLMTGGVSDRWVARNRVYDLHRFVSLLTLGVILLHAVVVLPDQYFSFSLIELFVPMASPYRPEFMAAGVLSLYLTGAIIATFYLRRLMSYPVWRLVHYSTFAGFSLALAHGIGSGTDTDAPWMQYLYAGTALIVFNLAVYRALKGSARGIKPSTGDNAVSARSLLRGE